MDCFEPELPSTLLAKQESSRQFRLIAVFIFICSLDDANRSYLFFLTFTCSLFQSLRSRVHVHWNWHGRRSRVRVPGEVSSSADRTPPQLSLPPLAVIATEIKRLLGFVTKATNFRQKL